MLLLVNMVSVALLWILTSAMDPIPSAAALPLWGEALVEWPVPLDYTRNCPPCYDCLSIYRANYALRNALTSTRAAHGHLGKEICHQARSQILRRVLMVLPAALAIVRAA